MEMKNNLQFFSVGKLLFSSYEGMVTWDNLNQIHSFSLYYVYSGNGAPVS